MARLVPIARCIAGIAALAALASCSSNSSSPDLTQDPAVVEQGKQIFRFETFGDEPTLADVCLVPQVANARRVKLDMAPYPRIAAVNETCLAHPAFDAARPEKQPDAE